MKWSQWRAVFIWTFPTRFLLILMKQRVILDLTPWDPIGVPSIEPLHPQCFQTFSAKTLHMINPDFQNTR